MRELCKQDLILNPDEGLEGFRESNPSQKGWVDSFDERRLGRKFGKGSENP